VTGTIFATGGRSPRWPAWLPPTPERYVAGSPDHRRRVGSSATGCMAALMTTRANPHLQAFYLRLRAAGGPAKVAVTAVMRELIILMNHVLEYPKFALAE